MINISIRMSPKWTEDFQKQIIDLYQTAIDNIQNIKEIDFHKLLDIEIILTDNLWNELNNISDEYKIQISATRDKEYWASIKSITDPNNPNHHLIILNVLDVPINFKNSENLTSNLEFFLVHQFLMFKNESYLPTDFLIKESYDLAKYDDIYEYLIFDLLQKDYLFTKMKSIGVNYISNSYVSDSIHAFKRKVRKGHFKYQSNKDNFQITNTIIKAIDELLQRSIEDKYWNGIYDESEILQKLITDILSIISNFRESIDLKKTFEKNTIIDKINDLFKICYVRFTSDEANNSIITILNNPKTLFLNEVLDTQDCFVAFIDILGFKNFINEHDTKEYSNILKRLKNSLDESFELAFVRLDKIINNEQMKTWGLSNFSEEVNNVKYRMFSDNFCFALPYFDNEKDFIIQFSVIVLILRIFQFKMFENGFTVRGGLSFGSFFSDDNMLFSGGLVNAYHLEIQSAKVPRIIIEKKIMERVLSCNKIMFHILGLTQSIVTDKSLDDYSFINPFDLDKGIDLNYDEISRNIEELYEFLEIDTSNYREIINFIKLLNNTPIISEIKLELNSPISKNDIINESSYNKLVQNFQDAIEDSYAKLNISINNADEKDIFESSKIISKYLWLKDFMLWTFSENEKTFERFFYPLSKITNET